MPDSTVHTIEPLALPPNFRRFRYKALIIGGSAGSFSVISRMLGALPADYRLPIICCLHRLRNKREGFQEALQYKTRLPVREPLDKQRIEPGVVWLAPANYHLLVEDQDHFAMAVTDLVQYSRPSIDVLFESAGDVYGDTAIGIMLSGANRDGARGIQQMKRKGSYTVVQDPKTCGMATMPQSALAATEIDLVLNVEELVGFLLALQAV